MDLKPNHTPVLTETAPLRRSKSRLGVPSGQLPYSPTEATFPHGHLRAIPKKKPSILDDVRSSGWLDAMKSSSPTHNKVSMDVSNGIALSDAEAAYFTWLLKFPSALASFEQITNCAKGKRIVLFLDYDGTLSPIVDNPECAFMSDNMRAAVKKVAEYFPTAIISGRSRDKVYEFVGVKELYYAGSHGMDIMGPLRQSVSDDRLDCIRSADKQGSEVKLFQPAAEFLPMIDESWDIVGQRVYDVLKDYPRLRLTHGRKVLEVRPVIDWDKGKAVSFLLESLGLNDGDDVLAIYVGDDRTDEDAFKVLREVNKGCGILVSPAPRESNAIYSLRDPSEVMEFLTSLAVWKSSIQTR